MKKIKDPLHGYIEIEDEAEGVLDSPEFHRLKDIMQTSYASVYPAAVDTRFMHSLGVYHLGKIAVNAMVKDIRCNHFDCLEGIDIDKLSHIFKIACLLHDVGHAPFSHTGEKFYRSDSNSPWGRLMESLNDDNFSRDSEKTDVGNQHEIMSALFAITYFADAIGDDKPFFVRCIIGLKYKTQTRPNDIKNCFIELLNSKTIDVDKLDYLLRDSYTTGFCTVKIDYMRLLNAVCVCEEKGRLYIAFDKSALSVLESVVMARDMERKWIQNHSIIKYDVFLTEYMIARVREYYKNNNGIDLFTLESISKAGNGGEIRLLSDSDIKHIAKNLLWKDDPLIEEYFDRSKRMKPLWKSENEYRILFEGKLKSAPLDALATLFARIAKDLLAENLMPVICNEALKYYSDKVKNADKLMKPVYQNIIKLMMIFKEIADSESNSMSEFKFAVITDMQFDTGFNSDAFKDIRVRFNNFDTTKRLGEIINLLNANKPNDKFFYVYCRCKENSRYELAKKVCTRLTTYAITL